MSATADERPVVTSNSSAVAVTPLLVRPPVMRTRPFASVAAAAPLRAATVDPSVIHVPDGGCTARADGSTPKSPMITPASTHVLKRGRVTSISLEAAQTKDTNAVRWLGAARSSDRP